MNDTAGAMRATLLQKKAELEARLGRITANVRRGFAADSRERARQFEDRDLLMRSALKPVRNWQKLTWRYDESKRISLVVARNAGMTSAQIDCGYIPTRCPVSIVRRSMRNVRHAPGRVCQVTTDSPPDACAPDLRAILPAFFP